MRERHANSKLIAALDQASSIKEASRIAGCSDTLIHLRAKDFHEVACALERNRARRRQAQGLEPREPSSPSGPPLVKAPALAPVSALDAAVIAPEIGIAVKALQRIANDRKAPGSAQVAAAKALLSHGEAKLARYGEALLRDSSTDQPASSEESQEENGAPEETEAPLTSEDVAKLLRAI